MDPIHVIEIGSDDSAPPVLLLHGFTGSARAWGASFLAELAVGRRVLAVDLPGHGQTAVPDNPAECGIEAVVDALVQVLDDREIDRADWVGYSMGGRVALAAAVTEPDRVDRLVLESASPGLADEAERAARRKEDENLAARIERRGMRWFVEYWTGLPIFESQHRLPSRRLEEARALRMRNRAENLAVALRGYGLGAQPSWWEALPELSCPTLVLTGVLDAKFDEIGARMATAIPHAIQRRLPDAGHAVHLEEPKRWLTEVTGFLGAVDRAGDQKG